MTKKTFLTGIWRFPCKRNLTVVVKQAAWTILFLQLCLICFVAVSFRDGRTREIVKDWSRRIGDTVENSLQQGDEDPLFPETSKDASGDWHFKDFDLSSWNSSQRLVLEEGEEVAGRHFREVSVGGGGHRLNCFIPGTDFEATAEYDATNETEREKEEGRHCVCREGYFGRDCGIPACAWHSYYSRHPRFRRRLRPRKRARRIVHAVLVNHEFDFFEARVKSLMGDGKEDRGVVDALIVQESNFTTYGSGKDLLFLDRFRDGWLREHQTKMVYVVLPFFKEKGKENGWYADAYIRLYISKMGLPKVHGLRDDDLFVLSDADELPSPESLLFLRLYDGYTEPVRFGFRWNVFGFFWLKAEDPSALAKVPLLGKVLAGEPKERLLQLYTACTVGMLRKVYSTNAMLMRRNVWSDDLLKSRVHNYTKVEGHTIREWDLGSLGHYAGHHCSWCYDPQGIRTKLESAQKHDKPRWGDFPEKTDLKYIAGLIREGGWFDDTRPFLPANSSDPFYAPRYVVDNPDRFGYLLEVPKKEEDVEENQDKENRV